jgi:cytosine deaminase
MLTHAVVDRVARAVVPGHGLSDLILDGGRVASVGSATVPAGARVGPRAAPPGPGALDASGRVVLPGFVDAHLHLDKAFMFGSVVGVLRADLDDAIAAVARLRGSVPPSVFAAGARRAVDTLVANGVTTARAHVELDPAVGRSLIDLHRGLAEYANGRLTLQLSAFPQRGLELPGMPQLLRDAVAEGLDVVGGCPYVDSDPAAHLDLVFRLAEKYDRPVDLHLDFTDDPSGSLIGLVAERTGAHGMTGRVTIGHVTTLAAMPVDEQAAALDRLAAAGIALVVLPATDLYLTGHGEPGTRSLAPVERAAAAGVSVAIANNNIQNPFAPYGNGSLLQAAWLAGLTRRLVSPGERQLLLDAVTVNPAAILGLSPHGPTAGAAADLTLLDACSVDDVVLRTPTVLATIKAGQLAYALRGLPDTG